MILFLIILGTVLLTILALIMLIGFWKTFILLGIVLIIVIVLFVGFKILMSKLFPT